MTNYISPTGSPIIGTSDQVRATATITGINPDGTPEYAGSTEIDWDSQVTLTRGRKILFLDEDGAEWVFSELTLEVADEEDDA